MLSQQPKRMLETLTPGVPFEMRYERARIDRNALFAVNSVFDKTLVSSVRTKYHRSHLNFNDLKANLLEYDKPRPPRAHKPSYYAAYESVRQDLAFFKGEKIIPLTIAAVAGLDQLPGNKSPGLPWKTLGFKTKKDVLENPKAMQLIQSTWNNVAAGTQVILPDVACYARSHIATRDKNKIRATWGYPMEVYLQEAAYFYPVLDRLKAIPDPIIAYGVEIGNGGMTYIHQMASTFPGKTILLGDWSGFDHTIPAWLIRDAFSLIAEGIDFGHYQDANGDVHYTRSSRSKRRWKRTIQYFIDTPIRLSNGERYMKHCGVPSGSCWTNVIDSIVNALVLRYSIYELTGSFPHADIYLGDDSVVILPKPISLDELSQFCLEQFGMVFNAEKSSQVRDTNLIHFLGYYNYSGTPYKPLDTIIASAIYPEYTVLDKVETITRLLGQAYSCFDPYNATQFVKAATVLIDEEGLSAGDLEEYIHRHPERFKYLSTIGVDPSTLGVPIVGATSTWRTLPSVNRKVFSPKTYDPDYLYELGIKSYFVALVGD